VSAREGTRSWQAVRNEVLRRIRTREWMPGDWIPHEVELAAQFECSRNTVNRALREIADSGLIERRRRAGTRVALHPVRKATLDIPVIRIEIEGRRQAYAYSLLLREMVVPPPKARARMKSQHDRERLHIVGIHMADGRPYALEDRWIDTEAVPGAAREDFTQISPNEWLVVNVPFEGGDITFSAHEATADEAEMLGCRAGAALFVTERTTWLGERTLTSVQLLFGPGYRLHTIL